mmetsp:Transcript_107133/g.341271  ORF Transcript_107133/g.341271 Transcript_107133/m.341271 type:complete len:291 (+) Transcript_107133:881-1753(+)
MYWEVVNLHIMLNGPLRVALQHRDAELGAARALHASASHKKALVYLIHPVAVRVPGKVEDPLAGTAVHPLHAGVYGGNVHAGTAAGLFRCPVAQHKHGADGGGLAGEAAEPSCMRPRHTPGVRARIAEECQVPQLRGYHEVLGLCWLQRVWLARPVVGQQGRGSRGVLAVKLHEAIAEGVIPRPWGTSINPEVVIPGNREERFQLCRSAQALEELARDGAVLVVEAIPQNRPEVKLVRAEESVDDLRQPTQHVHVAAVGAGDAAPRAEARIGEQQTRDSVALLRQLQMEL